MQAGKINRVTIIGGGSAGWMTAAYLAKAVQNIRVTVVESSEIPAVGVGEATIATISGFLSFLGLREADWMPHCNATYKYGIRFRDWLAPGSHYWHPFEGIPQFNPRQHLGHYWYRRQLDRGRVESDSLYADCFVSVGMMEQNRILKKQGEQEFVHSYPLEAGKSGAMVNIPYAYHFDAGLFGDYLKQQFAGKHEIENIIGTVQSVALDDRGNIQSLLLDDDRRIEGDLFIDCSGFSSLLLNDALGEPFQDYSDSLFVDTALAIRVPYSNPGDEMNPYTTATAKSGGWIWNIPVADRIGAGYVYSSAHTDHDAAERELRDHLGEKRVDGVEARRIPIGRVGKHRNTWVGNCVAIGLSSAFLEPIESTSLHFIYAGVAKLAEAIADNYYNVAMAAAYNAFITDMLEEARDFIIAHYALTQREDTPFWRDVKYSTRIPDSLARRLASCRLALPEIDPGQIIFKHSSWTCVLAGMNFYPNAAGYQSMLPQDLQQQYHAMHLLKQLGARLSREAVNHHRHVASLAAK